MSRNACSIFNTLDIILHHRLTVGPVELSCTHCKWCVLHFLVLIHCTFSPLRLAGFPPFWHRKQLVMLRNIMNGRFAFVSPEWDDITDTAKDLVHFFKINKIVAIAANVDKQLSSC